MTRHRSICIAFALLLPRSLACFLYAVDRNRVMRWRVGFAIFSMHLAIDLYIVKPSYLVACMHYHHFSGLNDAKHEW